MRRLEQLCVQYLELIINHRNVLSALANATALRLYFIKEFCLRFVVKESNYSTIVMSSEFETLDQPLMVEIIRRRQTPHVRSAIEPVYDFTGINLEQDMEMFLRSVGKEFCDVTLVLEDAKIPAHKAILAARCSYFEAMFRSFMPEDSIVNVCTLFLCFDDACLSTTIFFYI